MLGDFVTGGGDLVGTKGSLREGGVAGGHKEVLGEEGVLLCKVTSLVHCFTVLSFYDTCSVFVWLPGAYTASVLFPLFQLDRDKVASVIQDALQQPPKTAGNGTGPEIFPLPVQVPSS